MSWRKWAEEIGAGFWNSPASTSGRFHKPGETNWQHALAVYHLAKRCWRRVPWAEVRDNLKIYLSFLRGALFHDVGKRVDKGAHEVLGYRWMLKKDPLAAILILHHMGRWGCDQAERQKEMQQSGLALDPKLAWLCDLLASCDYFEAVCFDTFDQEEVWKQRW